MAWYDLVYRVFNKKYRSMENNDFNNNKETGLYQLSKNPEWYNKWCVRHRDFGADIPLMSKLGRTIINSNEDSRKLTEAIYAERKGESKPFIPSQNTIDKVSKI